MSVFSLLPGEIRNKIFALAIPQGTSLAPCTSTARLNDAEELHTSELAIHDQNEAQRLPQILFRVLTVKDNHYVYNETAAQAYTALLQVDRATRQETAAQFYESNNFVFPGCYFLPMFLDHLFPTTLSYIQNLTISAYLDIPFPNLADNVLSRRKGFPIESLWDWLGCIGQCSNLQHLNISLETTTCDVQAYLLDQFGHYGRDTIGLLPKINVAFTACETCKDPKKSQHWRWGSESGSHEWKVIHFIGNTQVQSLTQILAANPVSGDHNLKASSIDKIKETGAGLKKALGCNTCQGYPMRMPDDLRFSRGFWCKYCKLVFFCEAHVVMDVRRRHVHACVLAPISEPTERRRARWAYEDEAREFSAQKSTEEEMEKAQLDE